MIDRLILEGFQKHEKLDLALARIVTFVGPSDVGKSSVLRALRWLATNAPAGDAFVRRGAKGCSVAARIDGAWVARRRGKTENVYQVGPDLPLQLERGGSVPAAVAALLNVGPSNFAGQHDAPFWLGDTPGQAAKNLNGIVDLTRIDAAAEAANAGVRSAKAALDAAEARCARAAATVAAVEWADGCAAALDKLEDLGRTADRTRTRCVTLAALISQAAAAETRYVGWSEAALAGDAVVSAGAATDVVVRRRTALIGVMDAVGRAKAAGSGGVPPGAWESLLAARKAADDAADRRGSLDAAVADADRTRGAVCRLSDELRAAEAELAEATERTGGVCPTCGRPNAPSPSALATPTSAPSSPPPAGKVRSNGVDFKLPTPNP